MCRVRAIRRISTSDRRIEDLNLWPYLLWNQMSPAKNKMRQAAPILSSRVCQSILYEMLFFGTLLRQKSWIFFYSQILLYVESRVRTDIYPSCSNAVQHIGTGLIQVQMRKPLAFPSLVAWRKVWRINIFWVWKKTFCRVVILSEACYICPNDPILELQNTDSGG